MTLPTLSAYFRRPDRAFWRSLLVPPPNSTAGDQVRRARIVRFALGGATVLSFFYAVLIPVFAPPAAYPMLMLNLASLGCYGMGMWAAALGAHRLARLWLMVTLNASIAALVWLSGPVLGVGVYTLVAAVLARMVHSPEEARIRDIFITASVLILVTGMTVATTPVVDFSAMPAWMGETMRVVNVCFSLASILLMLRVLDKEVLQSEISLIEERERSDRLLHAVLPRKIALELRQRDRMLADHHPEVTVLFADIAGFTPWASQQQPEVVLSLLERIFTRFDARVSAAGAEKIKTIGDAYMVISGAPDPREDHAHVMAALALELVEEVRRVRVETGIDVDLRLGLHTGPVIAGVIGALRFTYDVWGDTVNTASRMESHGEPGRIQVSAETRGRIMDRFECEPRGMIDVKGKGPMETWWLLGTVVTAKISVLTE